MKNVIIVDDEIHAINNITRALLDRTDCHFSLFKDNPLSALEYASKNPIDIAFLDIRMPQIDGKDLAERILKINPNAKIVFITGFQYDEEEIYKRFSSRVVTILNKPFRDSDFLQALTDLELNRPCYYLSTFGNFDLLIDSKPVAFNSKKSKELLALLVDRNGKIVTMEEVICALWPDNELSKAKILYRDAVWKLRKILSECRLSDLVTFNRAAARVNKIIPCDYWEAIETKTSDCYHGEYLTSYEWSLETQLFLSKLLNF